MRVKTYIKFSTILVMKQGKISTPKGALCLCGASVSRVRGASDKQTYRQTDFPFIYEKKSPVFFCLYRKVIKSGLLGNKPFLLYCSSYKENSTTFIHIILFITVTQQIYMTDMVVLWLLFAKSPALYTIYLEIIR